MEQSELDKNEENLNPSSVELSELETVAEPEAEATMVVAGEATGAQDTPSGGNDDTATESKNDAPSDDVIEQTPEDDVINTDDDDEDDQPAQEEVGGIRRGEVIQGIISRTTPNEIFVDLGEGREGIVPKREVELMSGKVLEQMQQGAEIHVYVVNPSNHRGNIILSINHAQEELDWRKAEEYLESKQVYDGKIGGYNKGGLIVRFGRLRGFVPQSQISDKRKLDIGGDTPEERYGSLVNEHISVKVMEVDRSRNRLILSERAAMREVRQRLKEALITELQVGEVREGRVVSLENFGAFVDIGGAEGLVHITELSWQHVTHPQQVLEVGQEVEAKIIAVDENNNRIGLSIKQLKPDPWDELALRFGPGALIRGTVTKLTKFGAFARMDELSTVEGLIHISELSDERVEHPRDVVQKGDKLTLRIVKIDVKNRRLGLSLRRVNSAEFLDEDLKRAYRDQEENADIINAVDDTPFDGTEDIIEPEAEVEAAVEVVAEPETEAAEPEAVAESEAEAAEPEAVAESEAEAAEPEAVAESETEEAGPEAVAESETEEE